MNGRNEIVVKLQHVLIYKENSSFAGIKKKQRFL